MATENSLFLKLIIISFFNNSMKYMLQLKGFLKRILKRRLLILNSPVQKRTRQHQTDLVQQLTPIPGKY